MVKNGGVGLSVIKMCDGTPANVVIVQSANNACFFFGADKNIKTKILIIDRVVWNGTVRFID
jgi:hypothetical protein